MALEKFDLNGKVALITGGAGLLGVQHAAALLECGAKVVLTDVNKITLELSKASLIKSFDRNQIDCIVMDVSSVDSIEKAADRLKKMGNDVNILINNAAIDPKVSEDTKELESSRFENFSLNKWELEISVGLTGAFLCSQIFGSAMASSEKGGVILNISSDLSIISPDQRLYRKDDVPMEMQPVKPVTYSVIKTGLIGLTRYLATYWADKNVRCNALSPGGVLNGQNEQFVDRISNLIPLNRMASIDEYKSAIQFLCSDASAYMNGHNLIMDGGRSVW